MCGLSWCRQLGYGGLSVRCGHFGVLPLGVESQGTLLPPSRLHTTRQDVSLSLGAGDDVITSLKSYLTAMELQL